MKETTIAESGRIEAETQRLGQDLFARIHTRQPSVFEQDWWDERILEWCMRDEELKVQLFRFIDVFPMLKTSAQVARHLKEYFDTPQARFPAVAQWGLDLAAETPVLARAVTLAVRRNITRMAHRFVAGANLDEALPKLQQLWKQKMAFTLDLLGEATVSEAEARQYQQRYLELLDSFPERVAFWPHQPELEQDAWGPLPRVNLSLKLTSLYSQIDPIDPDGSAAAVKERVRPIFRRAQEVGASLTVDMEQYTFKSLTLRIFRELLEEDEFQGYPHFGIALQAYLRETERDVKELLEWIQEHPVPILVRLVRGAYWDYETVIARQQHWPVPVFERKWETDLNYERLTRLLLERYPRVKLALGSHNVRSIAHALALGRALGLPENALEFQMLYGMGDPLKQALISYGQRLRVYAPYGELIPGMAYLVRRLLENTSNHSFLRQSFAENHSPEEMLLPPTERKEEEMTEEPTPAFHNEPVADFAQAENRERMQQALDQVRTQFDRFYPLIIGAEETTTEGQIESVNPCHPSQVVGRVARAGQAQAQQALQAAQKAFPGWRDRSPAQRAEYLFQAAAAMRQRRFELAAWEVFECAKTWPEADADVAEAIDYMEYYGGEMLRLGEPQRLGKEPGEINEYFYQPRGIAVVIAPWNFPLAILTGMSAAALVTGNPVIMKPSAQSSVVAAQLMEIFQEIELPPGALNYLPGPGGEVGEYLVRHPDVALIAFTGSKEVGTRIYALAAEVRPGQRQMKRVIAEMGGKNAIIIDDDADLDDAVKGVLTSAFGYQGQKCSACSRAIVLAPVYDLFVSRLVEAARSLRVGPAEYPGVSVSALIDAAARDRVRQYIEIGRSEGVVALETDVSSLDEGYYVGPTIFTEVSPAARIAQEEIFGPVLAVIRAADFDQALTLAMGTEYALTGGLYSRNPAHLEQAKREFRVGNLYLNRKITGALVGRQPFGGFGMSGLGSKAGGPDYLLQFLEPRTVTENTLRRGFAPEALGES